MKNKLINKMFLAGVLLFAIISCSKKLDLVPQNGTAPEDTYSSAAGYKSVLAKLYGTLALSGNTGPAGDPNNPATGPDIGGGLDEGSQISFIRMYFNCQELPTDEAIVSWNDETIHDFHDLKWTSSDKFLKGIYARPVYNITLINEYIREATDEKLSSRGITGSDATDIKNSLGEARFLRAFNYWVMLDLFGKSTFITEEDLIGAFNPREINRSDLFNYVESELLAAIPLLAPAKTAIYGRVDQAAAWSLLARLYLNAKVYTGNERYADAATYAKKVIDAGYTLRPNYGELFMADNDKQASELIFTINCDGLRTSSYGNTTFFIHCAAGADFQHYGTNEGWAGYRATKGLADKFSDLTGATDKRALFTTPVFNTDPSQLVINDPSNFIEGLHVAKYRNVRSDGGTVSDPVKYFSDIDFPVFRLPEMYLIYAESALRSTGAGDLNLALDYMNVIRERAYGNTNGNIQATDLNLDYILDERARELYWEGHRRTDLIRYDRLTTGTYLWPWKGGVQNGTARDSKYNIFPVPDVNRNSNPNLSQNTGY